MMLLFSGDVQECAFSEERKANYNSAKQSFGSQNDETMKRMGMLA